MDTRTAMRNVVVLAGGYLAISLVTLVAIVLLRHDTAMVTSAVWVRGIIVTASAILTLLFARRAAAGSRRMYLRLRIITAIMPVVILVIVSLPGLFPVWMRIEQSLCGLLLITAVVILNGRTVRGLYAAVKHD